MTRGYDRALGWTLDHSLLMAVLTVATLGSHDASWLIVPKGLFPQQDTGLSRASPRRRRTSRRGRCSGRRRWSTRSSTTTPTSSTAVVRGRRAGRRQHGHGVRRARRTTSARAPPTRCRPLAARSCRPSRASRCSCSRCRTCASAVARRARSTSTRCRTPTSRSWRPGRRKVLERLRKLPELRDVNTDQQTAGIQLDVDRRPRQRRAAGHQHADDRRHALRRLRPAPGRDVVHAAQLLPRRAGGDAGQQASPDQLAHVYLRGGGRRAGPAVEHREVLGLADAAVDQPPGAASRDDAVVQPRARDVRSARPSRRSTPPSARSACRRRVHASFQGTAQAFGASLSSEPWLILAALFTVYVVLGILYESLIHPITIISTLPSAALGALIALLVLQARVQHHRAHRRRCCCSASSRRTRS